MVNTYFSIERDQSTLGLAVVMNNAFLIPIVLLEIVLQLMEGLRKSESAATLGLDVNLFSTSLAFHVHLTEPLKEIPHDFRAV